MDCSCKKTRLECVSRMLLSSPQVEKLHCLLSLVILTCLLGIEPRTMRLAKQCFCPRYFFF